MTGDARTIACAHARRCLLRPLPACGERAWGRFNRVTGWVRGSIATRFAQAKSRSPILDVAPPLSPLARRKQRVHARPRRAMRGEGATTHGGDEHAIAPVPGRGESRINRSGGSRMNICEPAIRRPVGTTLLAIGLLLIGAVAYRFLPVASMPTVDFPTISVTASRPGADPETMAQTVAAPLERRLGEIPGVIEMTSRSSLGNSPHHRAVRPQPRHRRRRPRRAGRDQRGADRPARRPAIAAVVPQIQSVGDADHDSRAHLADGAAERAVRRRRHRAAAAAVADRRRGRGHRQRRRAAGDPHPGEPDCACLHGSVHGGRAQRRGQHQCRGRRSARSMATAAQSPSPPTTSCAPPHNTIRSWCGRPTAP